MRKPLLLTAVVFLGLFAILPPVGAEEAGEAGDVAGGSGGGGVPGFTTVATHAQGQAATGYFFNVGNEENRLVGALSEIATPPSSSQNVAALVQRGVATSFIYGMAGGGGPGKAGVLPQPPPGEADAFYPAEPLESKFEGPVTAGAKGPVVDGRFYAKASDTPTGRADSAVSNLEVFDQLTINQAVVSSHTEPTEGGIAAESVSVLYGITVGPVQIETMVSRAYGFVPAAPGEPKGVATTVIDGASVNGTPVKITEKGVVVGDQASPGAQDQVNAALAEAGYSDVRLAPSSATPGEGNESVNAVTGTLRVVHRDEKMAQQFQGFAGGGFAVGGAEVRVVGHRCAPACPGAESSSGGEAGGVSLETPPPVEPGPMPPAGSPATNGSSSTTGGYSSDTTGAGAAATSADLGSSSGSGATTGSSAALGGSAGSAYRSAVSSPSSSTTTAATPPSAAAELGAAPSSPAASASPAALALAASSELNPKVASGLRDGILIGSFVLLGVVLVGARLLGRPPIG